MQPHRFDPVTLFLVWPVSVDPEVLRDCPNHDVNMVGANTELAAWSGRLGLNVTRALGVMVCLHGVTREGKTGDRLIHPELLGDAVLSALVDHFRSSADQGALRRPQEVTVAECWATIPIPLADGAAGLVRLTCPNLFEPHAWCRADRRPIKHERSHCK